MTIGQGNAGMTDPEVLAFNDQLLAEWTDEGQQRQRHLRMVEQWPTRRRMLDRKRGGRPLWVGVRRHCEAAGNLKPGQRKRLFDGSWYEAGDDNPLCNNMALDPPTMDGLAMASRGGIEFAEHLRALGNPTLFAVSSNATRAFLTSRRFLTPVWGDLTEREWIRRIRQIQAAQERDGGFENAMQELADVRRRCPWSTTDLYRRYALGESIFECVSRAVEGLFQVMWMMPDEVEYLDVTSHTWPLVGWENWFETGDFDAAWMDKRKPAIVNCSRREYLFAGGEFEPQGRFLVPAA